MSNLKSLKDPLSRIETLELALEAAEMAVWDYDYKNKILIRTEKHDTIYGYSSFDPSLTTDEFRNHILPEDRDYTLQKYKELAENGKIDFNFRILRLDGQIRWIGLKGKSLRDDQGKLERVIGIIKDITDQIKHEDEIREKVERSEYHLKVITEKVPAFISYTDHEGRYQYMNERYAQGLRRPIRELIGKTRAEILGAYASHAEPHFKKVLSGEASHHEAVITNDFGERVHLDIHFVPDLDPISNNVRGMIAVGIDMTERIEALNEAEKARKELHDLFMQAPAAMCLLNGEDMVFTLVNPLYQNLVGREIINKKITDCFNSKELEIFLPILRKVYLTGEDILVKEAPFSLSSERKFINVGYHPYKNKDAQTTGVLVIIIDVTEQVLAREKVENLVLDLQSAVNAQDDFLGVASHELKTPITALKLQMQMNQKILAYEGKESFNEEKLEKIFAYSINQADRLTRLVDDLLDVSRIESSKLTMNLSIQNLTQLVKEIFEQYQVQFEAREMVLTMDLDSDLHLPVDNVRLVQVLTNLIANALKYAPKRPLHVSLKQEENLAILKLKDNGPGISQEIQQKIFERFQRGSSQDANGLGLGLFISKQIVENHGGTIMVESELGEGSEFTVVLPM